MQSKHLRYLGLSFWLVAVGSTAVAFRSGPLAGRQSAALGRYFIGSSAITKAKDSSGQLQADDPVFAAEDDGSWRQVGAVIRRLAEPSDQIEIGWFGSERSSTSHNLMMFRNDGSLTSIVATMLPTEKREQIQQHLMAAVGQHGDELSAEFVPLVEQSLTRSLPVIEQEVRRAIARHQSDVDALTARWHHQMVQERMIPLAKQELLPIVRRHGEPVATEIGRELWNRASIWSFGWRVAYDRLPLTEQNLAQQEWDRFVRVEAIPVFEDHIDDMIDAIQKITKEAVDNEVVRQELGRAARDLAADPETRRLATVILKESLIGNEELHQIWREIWTGDSARRALDLAGDRLEPVVRRIGDELFGTAEHGINPDFARVLRNQVLGKDRRWIVATRLDGPSESHIPTIQMASQSMPYPIVHLAGSQP